MSYFFFLTLLRFPFKDEDVRCYHLNTLLSKKQGKKKLKANTGMDSKMYFSKKNFFRN